MLLKFDANLTQKDQVAVTLGAGRNPTILPFSGTNVPGYPIATTNRRYYASIAQTHTFNSNLLNVLRFNTQRVNTQQAIPGQSLPTPSALGIGVTPDNPSGPTRLDFASGLSIGFSQLAEAGLRLAGVIVGVVLVSTAASYAICRLLGIGRNMATLVACGNAICGNSAIVAVAPAIAASREDIASAITFSALLSVVVVLCLPLSLTLLALDQREYGTLAGLTIYAVPQVFAATSPVGLHAVQVGTIVKLVRVMMLGPIVVVMAALAARKSTSQSAIPGEWRSVLSFGRMVPPFIVAFLLLAVIGATGLVGRACLRLLAADVVAVLERGQHLRERALSAPEAPAEIAHRAPVARLRDGFQHLHGTGDSGNLARHWAGAPAVGGIRNHVSIPIRDAPSCVN